MAKNQKKKKKKKLYRQLFLYKLQIKAKLKLFIALKSKGQFLKTWFRFGDSLTSISPTYIFKKVFVNLGNKVIKKSMDDLFSKEFVDFWSKYCMNHNMQICFLLMSNISVTHRHTIHNLSLKSPLPLCLCHLPLYGVKLPLIQVVWVGQWRTLSFGTNLLLFNTIKKKRGCPVEIFENIIVQSFYFM